MIADGDTDAGALPAVVRVGKLDAGGPPDRAVVGADVGGWIQCQDKGEQISREVIGWLPW
jgi:hypothetical protein